MRLSDSTCEKFDTSKRKRRKKDSVKKWYSDEQKLEAVKCWLVTGNLAQTAAALAIPLPTLKTWKYSNWWKDLVSEIKTEKSLQLSNKLRKIAEKALDATEDRVDNGDYVYDQKLGKLVRKPLNAAVVHTIAKDLFTQADSVESRPEQIQAEQKTQDVLQKLQETFENFVKKDKKAITVTDVILGREVIEHEIDGIDDSTNHSTRGDQSFEEGNSESVSKD